MKVLFDTNVILDLLLERVPFYEASSTAIGLAEQGIINGWLCGTSVTTIHYLISKNLPEKDAKRHFCSLLNMFHIASITSAVLNDAIDTNFSDYEDAVIYQSTMHANLEAIITRNVKDFKNSVLPVYTPSEFLTIIESSN